MGLFGDGGGLLGLGGPSKFDRSKKAEELYGGVDNEGRLSRIADWSSAMGTTGFGNYQNAGLNLRGQTGQMRGLSDQYGQLADQYGRVAGGQNSISAEQLRQGLAQNVAGQQAMAAGAGPGNAAMAARQASMNAARMGSGLAGQQALAGLQERQNALAGQMGAMGGQAGLQQAIQQGLLQGRGQDLQMAGQGQAGALQGYGTIEQERGRRYAGLVGAPTMGESLLGGAMGGAALFATSDRRLKKDIKRGDEDADRLLKGLRAYRFKYRDEKHGAGDQLGIMAQDLEKAGLKHAVIDTPGGKMVHGAKLATALAAAASTLHRRVEKLERAK